MFVCPSTTLLLLFSSASVSPQATTGHPHISHQFGTNHNRSPQVTTYHYKSWTQVLKHIEILVMYPNVRKDPRETKSETKHETVYDHITANQHMFT